MKYVTVRARVKQRHLAMMETLRAQTGMSNGEILRTLLENATILQRPVLGATLEAQQPANATTPEAQPCP